MCIKVSIILTTYNCIDAFRKTMDSISFQDYDNIEVIIKDGMSDDGTVDAIKEYASDFKYPVIWESAKDTGIYDAMNKGYAYSTGDVIVFCNDKLIRTDAVSSMIKVMTGTNPQTGEQYIGAHADLVYSKGNKVIRNWHMGQGEIKDGWMPGHPTLFLRREVYEKYGLYDTSYKISADYEFMIRILKNGNRLAYLPETIVSMYYGGTSNKGISNYIESFKEGHRAIVQNGVRHAWLIDVKRTMRVLKQFK